MITGLVILIALFLALAFWLVGIRNRLLELRHDVQSRWSEVDAQLTRRDALIKQISDPSTPVEADVIKMCKQAAAQRYAVWESGGPLRSSLNQVQAAEEAIGGLHVRQQVDPQTLAGVESDVSAAIAQYNGDCLWIQPPLEAGT